MLKIRVIVKLCSSVFPEQTLESAMKPAFAAIATFWVTKRLQEKRGNVGRLDSTQLFDLDSPHVEVVESEPGSSACLRAGRQSTPGLGGDDT